MKLRRPKLFASIAVYFMVNVYRFWKHTVVLSKRQPALRSEKLFVGLSAASGSSLQISLPEIAV